MIMFNRFLIFKLFSIGRVRLGLKIVDINIGEIVA